MGEMHLPGFPLRFSEQTTYDPGEVPALGEHNAQILAGVLNYSDERIDALKKNGVIMSKDH